MHDQVLIVFNRYSYSINGMMKFATLSDVASIDE
jgi:hypothetical protein